jgi:superoxide dismutase, Cu-Zn family
MRGPVDEAGDLGIVAVMKTSTPFALAFLLAACGGASSNAPAAAGAAAKSMPGAAAALEPRSGSTVAGTADFADAGNGAVKVTVRVAGAAPGTHGVHLHDKGDCSAADGMSSGPHFNPGYVNHGSPGELVHHAGDLGNIEVGADGTGTLSITSRDLTIDDGPNSVVGHAVIVHEKADDLTSQPAGNAGARQACGVVKKAS